MVRTLDLRSSDREFESWPPSLSSAIMDKYKRKYNKGLRSETGQPLDKINDEKIKHRQ